MGEETTSGGGGRGRRVGVVLAIVALVILLSLGGLWARLALAPMHLPAGLQDRIEARINAAAPMGDIAVADMVLALPGGGGAPALEFRDVVLRAPGGDVRAAFPVLRLSVAPGPLGLGQMRVRRIVVEGAGVALTRDADGRVGLDFAGAMAGDGVDRTVAQTLTRLDAMFAHDAFSHLEEVRGVNMQATLTNAGTGRDIRLHSAEVLLTRASGRIDLTIAGELEGSRNAGLTLAIGRDAARGVTDVDVRFDTLAARDLAAASPALAWLDLMRAPIDGQMTAVLTNDGALGAFSGWLEIGGGEVHVPGQDTPLPLTAMEARLSYAPETRRAHIETLRVDAEHLVFSADGHADVSDDGAVLTGQFALRDIIAHPDGLFDGPLLIDGAALDLRVSLGEAVTVEVGQAVIYDDDVRIRASARAVAAADGLTLAVDTEVAEVDVATVLSYWPLDAIPNTRWWVAERLLAGTAHGANFALRMAPEADPIYDLSFDFTGADIIAVPAGPPILGASGYLSLQNDRLSVALDGGGVAADGQGAVALAGSAMAIADVSRPGPLAEFDLNLAGAVPDLMHVLAGPPFRVLDASGYAPDDIGTGQIVAEAALSTHLIERAEPVALTDLNIEASGIITGYSADALIVDRQLTSDRITVTMTPEQLAIGGRGALDRVPVTGQWSVLLDPDAPAGSRVDARATVDRAALGTFGVALPEWLIAGRGAADLTVFLQAGNPARVQVRSDLDGIALAIPPLAWQMPAARTGAFAAEITLGPRPEVRSLTLDGADLSLEGAVTFTADGALNRFSAGRFRVGQWLDVQGGLVGRGAAAPAIEVTGGILDFRTMPSLSETGGSGSGDVGPLNIRLNTMQIAEGISLTDLRADVDGASISGDFRGLVNGAAQISGQLVPSANGPSVRMQSSDGGAILRAAGIFDDLYGGAFDLILAARAEAGQYDGRLTIDNPRLRDAPVMAEMLNLISVVGLLEQLSGDGINLGDIDAAFRLTPQSITLQEGTAVGPAMGFSMDGVYDVASERYEMQGVVSPLYLVNGLIGSLFAPRREGLFGFNYRLIGDSEDTRVTVNPLSILTPGIFRDIFRAPPPDFSTQGN
ncbi:AsmA-like C-terminal region-containing protein [Jannaschia sp. CCS1]|uniref:AsmA-like C-terminal region-containing protein n=1 Tax=Jannaschia sp. (strain CCS1) TaxID=290400 RepID=UPI000053B30E|nr:AsmA-like C-terminal region-containing protein [Jannaschia sp. CCS1]ABD54633.1 hypothetical protein Jann_1716 [Jannaschia sp. CCS1]